MLPIINISRFLSRHPLTRHELLKAWIRFAGWQIRSRLHEEVLFPWVGGQFLAVRRGMTGATGNIYAGLHEFPDMMVVLHFLRKGDLFLDIGANVGSYTVLSAGVCQARTWAFEPDPNTMKHLKRNIAINRLDDRVLIYECALGATRDEILFTSGLDTTNKVVTGDNKNTNTVLIHQERLDYITDSIYTPNMMKIDVEGYEENVLKGSLKTVENEALKVIELETVSPWIEDMLLANCFHRVYYDPFSRKLHDQKPMALQSSNSLYVRDLSFVSARLAEAQAIEIFGHLI